MTDTRGIMGVAGIGLAAGVVGAFQSVPVSVLCSLVWACGRGNALPPRAVGGAREWSGHRGGAAMVAGRWLWA